MEKYYITITKICISNDYGIFYVSCIVDDHVQGHDTCYIRKRICILKLLYGKSRVRSCLAA